VKSGEIKLFIVILIIAGILVAFAVYPNWRMNRPIPTPGITRLKRELLIPPGSQIEGKKDAPYSLVEFGDYECPTCKQQTEIIKYALDKFGDKMNLVYHHCQISAVHKNSYKLASAAYAAAQQGKFWIMHDKLYEAQEGMRDQSEKDVLDSLMVLAGDAKLDILKFRSDMASDGARKAISDEKAMADKAGVNGTPAFFFVPKNGPIKSIPHQILKDWLNNESNWK
jgi:NhaA family Na+:H+ antiporter